jgi:hypothetical protein
VTGYDSAEKLWQVTYDDGDEEEFDEDELESMLLFSASKNVTTVASAVPFSHDVDEKVADGDNSIGGDNVDGSDGGDVHHDKGDTGGELVLSHGAPVNTHPSPTAAAAISEGTIVVNGNTFSMLSAKEMALVLEMRRQRAASEILSSNA